jgi:hypothetical protein
VVFDLTRKVHCNKMASEGFASCADAHWQQVANATQRSATQLSFSWGRSSIRTGRFQGEESKAHKPDKDEGVL